MKMQNLYEIRKLQTDLSTVAQLFLELLAEEGQCIAQKRPKFYFFLGKCALLTMKMQKLNEIRKQKTKTFHSRPNSSL